MPTSEAQPIENQQSIKFTLSREFIDAINRARHSQQDTGKFPGYKAKGSFETDPNFVTTGKVDVKRALTQTYKDFERIPKLTIEKEDKREMFDESNPFNERQSELLPLSNQLNSNDVRNRVTALLQPSFSDLFKSYFNQSETPLNGTLQAIQAFFYTTFNQGAYSLSPALYMNFAGFNHQTHKGVNPSIKEVYLNITDPNRIDIIERSDIGMIKTIDGEEIPINFSVEVKAHYYLDAIGKPRYALDEYTIDFPNEKEKNRFFEVYSEDCFILDLSKTNPTVWNTLDHLPNTHSLNRELNDKLFSAIQNPEQINFSSTEIAQLHAVLGADSQLIQFKEPNDLRRFINAKKSLEPYTPETRNDLRRFSNAKKSLETQNDNRFIRSMITALSYIASFFIAISRMVDYFKSAILGVQLKQPNEKATPSFISSASLPPSEGKVPKLELPSSHHDNLIPSKTAGHPAQQTTNETEQKKRL